MGSVEPRVSEGAIVVMRLYDVANAIDLAAVERLARSQEGTSAGRVRLSRAQPKSIAYTNPPVLLNLGNARVSLPAAATASSGDELSGTATARAYDFGAVSLSLRLPVRNVSWATYAALVRRVSATLSAEDAPVWPELMGRLRRVVDPALERPAPSGVDEDYLLATVQRFDHDANRQELSGEELLARVDIASLLAGETKPLSDGARRELLRHVFTYYRDDVVALSWDTAFVWDPTGESDVVDVLEVANAQLLELRYYDELLDAELPRMYDRVESTRRGLGSLSRGRFSSLARTIYSRVAEVTEIMERVDNALVVTEDVHLARIYGGALELFRVRSWALGVERKLEIMRDTYRALYEEAATARAEILEAAIVLLIVLEIVLGILRVW